MHDTSLGAGTTSLSDCESEQLHLSGKVQFFGSLMVVRLSDWIITHASDNAAAFLGAELTRYLGTDVRLASFWSSEWQSHIPATQGDRAEILLDGWVVTLILSGDYLILECEESANATAPIPVHQLHKGLIRPPDTHAEMEAYQETLVQHILTVSGMDRVMIYRFRDDWSGEVVAEAYEGSLGSYKGLRFPAGDIPAIARKLYEQNPIRTIPDVQGREYVIRSITPEAPDLSYSDLRSVSPMHLMYLGNMGVRASLSVPVLIGSRLWGLVVAHNYEEPCLLSQEQRHCAFLLTNAFSLGMASYRAANSLRMVDSVDRNAHAAMEPMLQVEHPLEAFTECAHAMQSLMEADAVAVAMEGRAAISGNGLSLENLAAFDRWFVEEHQDSLLMTQQIAGLDAPGLTMGSSFAGVLATKIWSAKRGWLRFYWFRVSETQNITWAGNPDKPQEAAGHVLGPRRSFEKWVEVRHGYSQEWAAAHRLSALRIRAIAGRSM